MFWSSGLKLNLAVPFECFLSFCLQVYSCYIDPRGDAKPYQTQVHLTYPLIESLGRWMQITIDCINTALQSTALILFLLLVKPANLYHTHNIRVTHSSSSPSRDTYTLCCLQDHLQPHLNVGCYLKAWKHFSTVPSIHCISAHLVHHHEFTSEQSPHQTNDTWFKRLKWLRLFFYDKQPLTVFCSTSCNTIILQTNQWIYPEFIWHVY